MAIGLLTLLPQNASLKVVAGSYESGETRLEFGCGVQAPKRLVDRNGASLTEWGCSLRVYDGSASVHAEKLQHGVGSIRYRPPSPTGLHGDCVIQVDLSSTAFAGLLAVCLAGRWPEQMLLEVDGIEEQGGGAMLWDRHASAWLDVMSISTAVDLPRHA